MNRLSIPRLGPPGVDLRFISSGAHRTTPYPVWLEQERKRAAAEGRSFRAPPVDRNGVPLDIAHYADPDEARDIASIARAAAAQAEATTRAKIARQVRALETRDTDPMYPNGVPTPGDYTNEFGIAIDTTEILALCEEVGLYNALPEVVRGTKQESWKELTELDFASGCAGIAFPAGACPEDSYHHTDDGGPIALKHLGVRKTLTESDIMDSAASIAAGYGVSRIVGGFNDQGLPGELDTASLLAGSITNVKEKEMRLGMILTLNGWDDLLVNGDVVGNPLEFDGITNLITAVNGARACTNGMTGTFSAANFERFIAAGCAHPQAVLGHPAALAEIAQGYFAIGYQMVVMNDNANVVPGVHFANQIMTGVGPLALIGDTRFPRQDLGGGRFRTIVYPVRLTHNGENLIYKRTQIPLAAKDLMPGCSAVSFEVWAVTALVVKAMCAQALCEMTFEGIVDDGCAYVHPCTPALLHAPR